MIQHVHDTFLRYLADNLEGLTIAPRRQGNGTDTGFTDNAINVEFVNIELDQVAGQQVVLDLIYSDEHTALTAMQTLWDLLKLSFYTPLLDYTDPTNPVPVANLRLVIERGKIRFMRVAVESYCHYTCQLTLGFVAV